ncbi:hypothetical protein HNQ94_000050 [Salirhabdus euzebyi]|uniref:Uncharacterized protein n=1 Tax=Salirhabdus euzebyi TaxID=394506 RepID=A0A841PS48_9BACI|nr:hypothetical protein [Salirhabdus euzebyi]MBB6451629.1 hypothetical protein [Salirhabdus euzebyi]
MTIGGRSYLQERVLYEYMYQRVTYSKLVLKLVVKEGNIQYKSKNSIVNDISIYNGNFPDVDNIIFKNDSFHKDGRPAEVKFLTSEFNYHKDPNYSTAFKNFLKNRGCIIVLRNNTPPKGLLEKYPIDIYELDYDDFDNFVKENHDRFLHKQIKGRSGIAHKTWLFSATKKNFYSERVQRLNGINVLPAMKSGIWCPKNLTDPNELAENDKVIFIRFSGPQSTQVAVRSYWEENKQIHPDWIIKEIWIGTVTIPLVSREQYCQRFDKKLTDPLWLDEVKAITDGKPKYWPQVFGFKINKVLEKDIFLAKAHEDLNSFVYPILFNLFIQQNAIEISDAQYISLLEWLTTYEEEVALPHLINNNENDPPQISN